MLVKLLHPENALFPIVVTPSGISTLPCLVYGHCINTVFDLLYNTPSISQ